MNICSKTAEILKNIKINHNLLDNAHKQIVEFINEKLSSKSDIFFEIGFGTGDNIIFQLNNSNTSMIACDPFENGAIKIAQRLSNEDSNRLKIISQPAGFVLPIIQNDTIDKVFVLFPDPWPKKRHNKRRIFSEDFLKEIFRIMKKNSQLWIATDNYDYGEEIVNLINSSNNMFSLAKLEPYSSLLPQTKYMKKAKNPCYSLIVHKLL